MKEAHSVSDHAPARRTASKPRWYWVSLAILLIVIALTALIVSPAILSMVRTRA